MSDRYPGMTAAEKAQCLDLAALLDRVRETANGRAFTIDLLMAMGSKAGFVLIDQAEYDRLMRGQKPWLPMGSAPMDGTVIELCARYTIATAGFPRYGSFVQGAWREASRQGLEIVPWAWRPRDAEWPHEGGDFPS